MREALPLAGLSAAWLRESATTSINGARERSSCQPEAEKVIHWIIGPMYPLRSLLTLLSTHRRGSPPPPPPRTNSKRRYCYRCLHYFRSALAFCSGPRPINSLGLSLIWIAFVLWGWSRRRRSMAAKAMVLTGFVLALVVLSLCFVSSLAELPRVEHPPMADGSLNLLVVGDWGRRGLYNQTEVATQMGRIGEQLDIDFVISTGDNFYEDGLTAVDDVAFHDSFTNVYTAKSLQKPWYSVLGNHDYRGDVIAQLSPLLKGIDCRWLCMRSFLLDAGLVQFFMVDTTPFVLHYWTKPTQHHYDWREVAPRDRYLANLLKELDSALEASTAQWKFVVGHHTMRSVSDHGDTDELVELLLPILKARDVDMYINGHDHCLEHISSLDSPLQFLTSGGGSKAWRGVYKPNADKLRFFHDGQGFTSLQVTGTRLEMVFYDVQGNALYRWSTTKELHPSL